MRLFDLDESLHSLGTPTLLSFSMQRSGQHVVIDWLCRGLGSVAHFNHCRLFLTARGIRLQPMTGRVSIYRDGSVNDTGKVGRQNTINWSNFHCCNRELYSMEDVVPDHFAYRGLCKAYGFPVVVILRDPANWLASTFRHPKTTPARIRNKLGKFRRLLEMAVRNPVHENVVFINYNQFIADAPYRVRLANDLGLISLEQADSALERVPDFGGGSSFEGLAEQASLDVEQRWRQYEHDSAYRQALSDPVLRRMANEFFGKDYLAFLN